jgi:hypothetical protein
VLNWSQRRQWQGSAPEVRLFREFVGGGGTRRLREAEAELERGLATVQS